MAQARWCNILTLMAFLVFTIVCRQALHMTPVHVSQLKTEAQSLSGKFPCMHPVTIVSAYYPLNHSKHSLREYTEWIAAFLPYVSAPIVLYSPPGETLNQIHEFRGDLPMTVKVRQLFNKMQTSRRLSFTAPPYTFPNAHW